VQYAAGVQYRDEGLDLGFNDDGNLAINPGMVDPVTGDVPGLFTFLRGGIPESVSQDIYAIFGELSIPMADNFDVQLALRYEDYGGNIGDSIDPKIAVRWDVSDAFTLRASASTTFRGPSLIQTSVVSTSLELIGQELAFKAIDRVGNKNLAPEDATTFNIGLQWRPTNSLEFLLDYWNFDLGEGIVRESPNNIVANCPTPTSTGPLCSQISFQTSATGTTTISRIVTNYQNGPDIKTDGIDFAARIDIDSGMGEWRFELEGANVISYDVDPFQGVSAFDAAGRLNAGTFLRPIPELKATFAVGWTNGNHDARLSTHYVDSYIDDGLGILRGSVLDSFITELEIESHTTIDFHYSFAFNDGNSTLSFAAINLTDEDPPAVRQDLRYDARTVSPLGAIYQLGIRYKF
jgi:outer membrane receptor protein involved in Fe transport